MCPSDLPRVDDLTSWLADSCRVIERPALIAAVELVPAITGDHAKPPHGDGWRWDEIVSGCRHLRDSLPAVTALADEAPPAAAEYVDPLHRFVEDLGTFSDRCLQIAPRHSYSQMQSISHYLSSAADTARELKRVTEELMDDH